MTGILPHQCLRFTQTLGYFSLNAISVALAGCPWQRSLCFLQLSLKETLCPILGDDSIVESLLPGNNKNEKLLRQASAAAVFSFS